MGQKYAASGSARSRLFETNHHSAHNAYFLWRHEMEERATPSDTEPTLDLQRSFGLNTHRFLDHCRVAKGLSANTLRAYASDLRHASRVFGGDADVAAIDRDAVRDYVRRLLDNEKRKETTAKRRVATLKIFFKWLEREEVIPLSVFKRVDLSIRLPKRLPRALDIDDMRRLLRCAEARRVRRVDSYQQRLMHFVVVALFTTGVRISELVSLQMAQVSVLDGSVQVRGKGNRERRVYLPGREALRVLSKFVQARRKLRGNSTHLLLTKDGDHVSAAYVRQRLRRLARKAGIERRVTPHMLRHTAATQLLEAGVDIRFVQKLLGHSSIATTQIYTQVRDGALKEKLARANTLGRLRRVG